MESSELTLLLKQLLAWPKTQSEKDDMAGKIGRLLRVPCFVIYSPLRGEGIGVYLSDSERLKSLNRGDLAEFMSHQIQENGPETKLRQLKVSRDGLYWPGTQSIQTFSVFPWIPHSGFVAMGFDGPVNERKELEFLVLAQHLADLFRIEELQADVLLRNQFLSIASHVLKNPLKNSKNRRRKRRHRIVQPKVT